MNTDNDTGIIERLQQMHFTKPDKSIVASLTVHVPPSGNWRYTVQWRPCHDEVTTLHGYGRRDHYKTLDDAIHHTVATIDRLFNQPNRNSNDPNGASMATPRTEKTPSISPN